MLCYGCGTSATTVGRSEFPTPTTSSSLLVESRRSNGALTHVPLLVPQWEVMGRVSATTLVPSERVVRVIFLLCR